MQKTLLAMTIRDFFSTLLEVSETPSIPFSHIIKKSLADDAQIDDNFGRSVSISGDYAIVGANLEDGGTGDPVSNAGAAYIY